LHRFIKNTKNLVSFIAITLLLLVHHVVPSVHFGGLSVGSGSITGKSNIEEFFNHISMHKDVEEKSLAELAPSYEVAAAYLVHML
jgi:hypothetical protein